MSHFVNQEPGGPTFTLDLPINVPTGQGALFTLCLPILAVERKQ